MSHFFIHFPTLFVPVCILLLSIAALAIIIERFYVIYNYLAKAGGKERKDKIQIDELDADNVQAELSQIRLNEFNIYNHGIINLIHSKKIDKFELEIQADEYMMRLSFFMKKRLSALGTISSIAPLTGLLGTVTGMIKSFHAFSITDMQNQQLMSGVDEALVTTAMGLLVGIPALVFYNAFAGKINELLLETQIALEKIISWKIARTRSVQPVKPDSTEQM